MRARRRFWQPYFRQKFGLSDFDNISSAGEEFKIRLEQYLPEILIKIISENRNGIASVITEALKKELDRES